MVLSTSWFTSLRSVITTAKNTKTRRNTGERSLRLQVWQITVYWTLFSKGLRKQRRGLSCVRAQLARSSAVTRQDSCKTPQVKKGAGLSIVAGSPKGLAVYCYQPSSCPFALLISLGLLPTDLLSYPGGLVLLTSDQSQIAQPSVIFLWTLSVLDWQDLHLEMTWPSL